MILTSVACYGRIERRIKRNKFVVKLVVVVVCFPQKNYSLHRMTRYYVFQPELINGFHHFILQGHCHYITTVSVLHKKIKKFIMRMFFEINFLIQLQHWHFSP